MKNYLLKIIILSFVFSPYTLSQKWKLRRYEFMVGIGSANYFGDIGGSATEKNLFGLNDIDIESTRPSIYVGARFKIKSNIHIKVNFISGWLSGSDQNSQFDYRNFHFKSFIQEYSVMGEYYFMEEEKKFRSTAAFNRRGMINDFSRISAYVSAGMGGFYFNPKLDADFTDRNETPEYYSGYSKVALAIPASIGIKYILDSKWALGFELGGRFTTTDFLDGFKSFYSKANDIYYFSSVSLIYRIKTDRRGRPLLFQ